MKAITTKGHEVFALHPCEDPATRQKLWSGKIRFNDRNPGQDAFFDWVRSDFGNNGVAIGHDMGDLIRESMS